MTQFPVARTLLLAAAVLTLPAAISVGAAENLDPQQVVAPKTGAPGAGTRGAGSGSPEPGSGVQVRPQSGARSKVSWFPEMSADLGEHDPDATASKVFKFQNPHDKEHKFRAIQKTCQCTEARVYIGDREYLLKNTERARNALFRVTRPDGDGEEKLERVTEISIGPKASGEVHVKMDMQGQKVGKKTASLDIHTTDNAQPLVKLSWSAMAVQMFHIDPPDVSFNKMQHNETREFRFRVSAPIQESFNITGHDTLPEGVKLEMTKGKDSSGRTEYLVKGTFGPVAEATSRSPVVRFNTDVKGGRSFEFRIHALIDNPVSVSPQAFIAMGMIPKGNAQTREFRIVSKDGTNLMVEKLSLVKTSVKGEGVSLSHRKDGNDVIVELKVSGDLPGGLVHGEIKVELNHPAVPEQSLRFNGFIR